MHTFETHGEGLFGIPGAHMSDGSVEK